MPKVLVISRHFPPLGSAGGSIRLVKFFKYTSLKGWQFVVLTQDLEKTVVPEVKLSASLLGDIPSEAQIVRVPAPFRGKTEEGNFYPLNLFGKIIKNTIDKLLGDSSLAWGLSVFFIGVLNLKKWKIDLIYSVCPPFTDALIGVLLVIFGQKPLVLDLRDDWVGSPSFLKKPMFRQKVESMLERIIVASTTAVVTVTSQSQQLYSKRYNRPGKPNKIFCIPNGADLEEYIKLVKREKRIETQKFTILCVAFGFQKDYRDITPFLTSFKILLNRHPEARKNIDVILLGNSLSTEYQNMVIEMGLQEIIKELGIVNRKELVEHMWKADLFLLIQPVNNTTAISGTLYEYWATGKAPVLLISEKGASSSLVETHNFGKHFLFSQIDQCTDYIETLYQRYQIGDPVWISREGIEQFDRRTLADKMETVWRKALSNSKSAIRS